MHPFISVKQIDQTIRHDERIQADRQNTVEADPVYGHLASFQVNAIEQILDVKQLSPDLPFIIELYEDGLDTQALWYMFCNSYWEGYGAQHAFSTALNALLCHERTKDRVFVEIINGLTDEANHIVKPMQTLLYYVNTFKSNVLGRLNQCRMSNGDLVSQESLIVLSACGFSKLLFESSARNKDVEAFHYLLKHVDATGGGQTMLRNCARKTNAPKSFIKAVLGAHEAVSAFAYDIVETVKEGDIARIDEIYDQPLVEQCFHELFLELMDISLPNAPQIKAAQHFMGRVVTSGIDTYRTFLAKAFHSFVGIDLLKQKRLNNHEIINGVLRLYTPGANSLDVFLLGLDIQDIHTHPKAKDCFDRMHKLTGDKQYLKMGSNAYKSKLLEEAIGL